MHLDPLRLDRAFELVERQVGDGLLGTALLAVAPDEGPIRCAGHARDGTSLGPDTPFPIASITKPITATAVMQLVGDGRLVLSEPLSRYLPEFDPEPVEPGRPGGELVTTWHVLTHTAGLGDPSVDDVGIDATPDDLADWACTARLSFVPGTAYTYASNSFYLLARIVERLTGLPYHEHLRVRLLEPLGMTNTGFDPDALPGGAVPLLGMSIGPYEGEQAAALFAASRQPGGGLWSSAADLVRFGRAMLEPDGPGGGEILARPFVELMTREHTAGILEPGNPPRNPRYGLGWASPTGGISMPGQHVFGHGGGTGTRLWIDADNRLVIVFLTNSWGTDERHSLAAISAVYAAVVGGA